LRERAAIVLEGATAAEFVEMGGEDALRRWAVARALTDVYRRRLGYEPPRASRSAHATLARLEAAVSVQGISSANGSDQNVDWSSLHWSRERRRDVIFMRRA
jgi:hypothetical protein